MIEVNRFSRVIDLYIQVKMLFFLIVITLVAQAIALENSTFDPSAVDLTTKSMRSLVYALRLRI